MAKGEAPDLWRDEDGPGPAELERFLGDVDRLSLEHPDRVWTSITLQHRDELYAKARRVIELEARVAELEHELERQAWAG